jgi:hypothetical protein
MGKYLDLARMTGQYIESARDRSDLLMLNYLGNVIEPLLKLAQDDPDAARDVRKHSLARWIHRGFGLQQGMSVETAAWIEVYAGNPAEALQTLEEAWPQLKKHQLLRALGFRFQVLWIRARAAIAAAATAQEPAHLLRLARRDAEALSREGVPWLDSLSNTIHAALLNGEGKGEQAVELLRKSTRDFEQRQLAGLAAASKWALGSLLPGSEGTELIASAEEWLKTEGIVNPLRWTQMLVPGFRSTVPLNERVSHA